MNLYANLHREPLPCNVKPRFRHDSPGAIKLNVLVMRMTILAILLTLNGMLIAGPGSGQDLSKIKVSLEVKNVSLSTALKRISKLTDLPFSYKVSDIAGIRNVSIDASDVPVQKVLDDLFALYGLQYELVSSNIIIRKTPPVTLTVVRNPAEQRAAILSGGINGRILNATGEPVSGASVELLGTTYGTAADAEGRFTFPDLPAGNYRVQVSAVGFTSQVRTVTVTDGKTAELSFNLDDV